MILADAGVRIDYLATRPSPEVERLKGLISSNRLAVADITLTEVLQGIRDQHQYERTLFRFSTLPCIVVSSRAAAIKAAANYRCLSARGITMRGTIDTLIATRCIEDTHSLLFKDRDFDPLVEYLGLISAMAV